MGDAQDTNTPDRSSRWTLTWGGAAVALATVFPLLSSAGFVFPSIDVSWMYSAQPVLGGISAVLLIAGFIVLAVGLGGETGIAGSSVVGKSALILFGVTHVASTGYLPVSAPGIGAGREVLAVWATLIWGLVLLSLVALAVAAVVVFRAGVVRGLARWSLAALGVTTVLALLASQVPSLDFITIWIDALILSQVLQLATGVLFIVEGQRASRGNGLRVASA
ncbi:hypothetical protein [Leifsonia sp. TF02-11]|uniref:hypothetical protein n=1 Tax=Leifsonia sp. TF02-11 TaxID=2815212 RepID=UPI001AA1BEE1|nr:hypothetical protein [Leifsonia sp. TF02-11]MBO1740170.1 hypothetical protein [Leifsonia sp. TF02-11]